MMFPFIVLLTCQLAAASSERYFKIQVVDEQTGRGVPLVELTTTHNLRFYTDSNGYVAFDEPGLMDKRVFFSVKSHGYEFPKDGFGFAGTALEVKPGGSAVLKIKRINVAERLYRLTGGGIYRDTVLLGMKAPIREPILNGQVLGCDSIQGVLYRGRLFWMWGDTNRPSYPLGNFHMTGATSALPSAGGLDPEIGIEYEYFLGKDGFVKEMAPHPGPGPVWLDGLVTLPDQAGGERLYASYARVNTRMEAQERGLMRFNDDKEIFEKIAEFDLKSPVLPGGHPFKCRVNSSDYIYYTPGFPLVRIPADARLLTDPAHYEAYTPLVEGSRMDSPRIDRDPGGRPRYAWRKNTPFVSPADQAGLIEKQLIKQGEALIQTIDVETGKPIQMHGSSVYWNQYRRRWLMIATQIMGSSMLGEIWYAEADTPLGPWVYARKIITHDRYSFYNPKQHPLFAKDDGRVIFFEGTYTSFIAGAPVLTPWYDYNQIMYKLDLADPRLALPAPVYQLSREPGRPRFGRWREIEVGQTVPMIAFFAPDRPFPGGVPVYQENTGQNSFHLVVGQAPADEKSAGAPLFYALPADGKDKPPGTVPLYECVEIDNRQRDSTPGRTYLTTASAPAEDYRRSEKPLCFVWQSPYAAPPPLPVKEDLKPAPAQ